MADLGKSLTQYTVGDFIQQMTGTGFDFSMDDISQLCMVDPTNCMLLLNTLENGLMNYEEEGINDDHVTKSDFYIDKRKDLLKMPPRHILLLVLLPFFPLMLLFTASGGISFFVTAAIEVVLRLVLFTDLNSISKY